MRKTTVAYLGLGSNLGQREQNLAQALAALARSANLEAVSSVYETEPMGYREQPRFLNLVCRITTDVQPLGLLATAKDIEADMGRVPGFPNAPRIIDIDVLFYDAVALDSDDLVIPHPRLADRAFVLIPLAEIAPNLIHPGLGTSIAELANNVAGRDEVRRLTGGLDVSAIRGRAL